MGNGKRVREVMERENGLEILSTEGNLSQPITEGTFSAKLSQPVTLFVMM